MAFSIRFFAPITRRCSFGAERALTPPILTSRTIFDAHESTSDLDTLINQPQVQDGETTTTRDDPPKTVEGGSNYDQSFLTKPKGGPNRTDGYNLAEHLSLNQTQYEDIKTAVLDLVREHLTLGKPYTKQNRDDLSVICTIASARYPILARCQRDWATQAFIQVALAAENQKWRRQGKKAACVKGQNEVSQE